ncbi:molybdenum cofactor guanylyltransferase MobA [Methylobacterium sp. BTF04]|uniref:molybdenum cofactor guanylyltransferase MobA n=1 Tax=Methylobacterium sp. BTF04 TaxID=2708300 RepID=UPI0013D6119E|nr:molybdenum cofactor guanylyltransferase MobA [Methylobacterium sp. BTF04]NEU11451.1 molybdenum cofactor guanylyltransferase MobA [Methylobacterium sp. BTF04]
MPPVLGVILAGGLSRRMGGGDKPLLTLGGRPLLDRVVERFTRQCPAGLILNANGDPTRFAGFPGMIVRDDLPDHPGPLAGLLAALDHAAAHYPDIVAVASVTGDAPFLPPDLVERLEAVRGSSGTEIAIAASDGRAHFTIGLWPVALRVDLRRFLVTEGGRRVGAFLDRHAVSQVDWPAEPVDPFLNVNTPDDLARAERALTRSADP